MSARRAAILCGAGVCVLLAQMVSRGQTLLGKTESNKPAPSAEEAKKYIANAETKLLDLGVKASRASWVEENFITEDTEKITADANEVLNTASTTYAKEALQTLTGQKQMDATALADYFAPLKTCLHPFRVKTAFSTGLDDQNKAKGYPAGW